MKIHRFVLAALVALPAIWAQATPSTYATIACLKLAPGVNASDYRKYFADLSRPINQAAIDSDPRFRRLQLLRNAVPGGVGAACDYQVVRVYAGFPTRVNLQVTPELLEKAGLKLTAGEYLKRRNETFSTVRNTVIAVLPGAGASRTGDIFAMNYIKIARQKFAEWDKYETSSAVPYHKELIQQEKLAGYFRNSLYFSGVNAPYNAMTIRVFHEWSQLAPVPGRAEIFAKFNSGKTYAQVMTSLIDVYDVVNQEVYQLVEQLDSKQPAPRLSSGN